MTLIPQILLTACVTVLPVHAAAHRVLAADDSTHLLAIIEPDGSLARQTKVGAIHDASLLPNGNILYQNGFTKIIEETPDHKAVWQYDAATSNGNSGKRVEVHAFQRVENDLTMLAESGTARVIEVDRDGKLHREIKLRVDHPDAHMDTRLVRKIASGNYLVAQQFDGCVREYDPTGKIVWEFEQPLFGKERKPGHGPEAFGNYTFSAIRLPNGNTLIGGGNGHCVLEVTPAKQIVWKVEQNDLPGITLAWVTRVQRLPNGNTVLGNCHAGPDNPQLIEITNDKKVIWTWKDFKNFGNSTTVQMVLDPH
jgi:hypothetical protein